MSKKGFFISVEGTDGCGKTTQLKLIEKFLLNQGFEVVMLREPGGTQIGEKIRDIILDTNNSEMENLAEMLLYASSRAQMIGQVVIPSLEMGKIVVCDRFIDSSLVYQGVARGLGMDNVLLVNKLATRGIFPDLTLFFDINPEISLNRRILDSKADRLELEGIDFQKKVYKAYKDIANIYKDRIKIIDATLSVDEVFESLKYYLLKLIGG